MKKSGSQTLMTLVLAGRSKGQWTPPTAPWRMSFLQASLQKNISVKRTSTARQRMPFLQHFLLVKMDAKRASAGGGRAGFGVSPMLSFFPVQTQVMDACKPVFSVYFSTISSTKKSCKTEGQPTQNTGNCGMEFLKKCAEKAGFQNTMTRVLTM